MVTAITTATNPIVLNTETITETETVENDREVTVEGYQSYTLLALTIISAVGTVIAIILMSSPETISIGLCLYLLSAPTFVVLLLFTLDSFCNNPILNEDITLPRDYRFEDLGINTRHFEEVLEEERNTPEPPAYIEIEQILAFVEKMNFTDETRPDYMPLRRNFRHDDEARREVQGLLRTYVNHMRYADENTKKYLKLIIDQFSQIHDDLHDPNSPTFIIQSDPRLQQDEDLFVRYQEQLQNINRRNQILMQLARSTEGCDTRQKIETYEAFRKAYRFHPTDFGDDIKERLLHFRYDLIYAITAVDGYGVDVHFIEDLLSQIGPQRGITNNMRMDDEFFYELSEYFWRFDGRYNKEKLLELVKHWIDGIEGENGLRHREVEWERATDWFKAHMPDEYRALDPGAEYQNAEERYLYEHVYQSLDETDYPQYGIKPEAVEYFLQTIGVVN